MIEDDGSGHLQRGGAGLTRLRPGHRVGPSRRRGATGTAAGAIRTDREGRRSRSRPRASCRTGRAPPRCTPASRPPQSSPRPAQRPGGRAHPAVTLNDAVPVLPPSFPVTVCAPADVAVQLAPLQEPFGPIEKLVLAVTSPSEWFEASKPSAVYACEPPAVIDALEGLTTMWSRTAVTWREAVPVAPRRLPVTVWMPAAEAVQVAARQDPSGEIENAALDVTSPRELLYWSRPSVLYTPASRQRRSSPRPAPAPDGRVLPRSRPTTPCPSCHRRLRSPYARRRP